MENREGIKLSGQFKVECYDEQGNLKWVDLTHNIVTGEGINRILNTMFKGTTVISTWYASLVDSNTTATATMNYDVPIFTEGTGYDEATRVAYVVIAATQGTITNAASVAVFTIASSTTMYGAALFSQSTKGAHAAGADNVLYCMAAFSTSRAVVDNDVINLTYAVSSTDDGA